MSLKLSKLHIKNRQESKSNNKLYRLYLTIDNAKICA